MIHDFCAQFDDILIRPLHRYDIDYLRQWRNNKELSKYLRDVGTVDEEAQQRWYDRYLRDTDTFFFAVDYKRKRTVGALALYNFEQSRCEIGKFVIGESETKGHKVGQCAFLMAMGIAHIFMGVQNFHLSVHEENAPARHVYERLGFYVIGSHDFEKGGKELEMMVEASQLKKLEASEKIRFFKENDTNITEWRKAEVLIDEECR